MVIFDGSNSSRFYSCTTIGHGICVLKIMGNNQIEKMALWALLIIFSLIALIAFTPYLSYIVIGLGVIIPAYLLFRKK